MSDYFIFDDIDTRDYENILVYFDNVDTTPKRVGEFIEIPSRNGSFFLDGGRYEDVKHTYDIIAITRDAGHDLINALANKIGYFRLEDSFNPEEYYSAVFDAEIEPTVTKERDKITFKVTFTRKPQRWLKEGEERISADSGDIITNPTRFKSNPMIEIEGYGTIEFNGYEIELEDAVMGDTIIIDSGKVSGTKSSASSSNYFAYLNFHPDAYNVGDTITYGDISLTATVKLTPLSGYHVTSMESLTEGLTFTAVRNHDGTFDATYQYTLPSGSFTSGQSGATIDNQLLEIKMNYGNGASSTCSNRFSIYSGWRSSINRQQFQLSLLEDTLAKPTAVVFRHGAIRADSTLSLLGNPTYIDCDLGEAYMLKNNVPISLNAYIDLGSDLPNLASGSNEITYDNTVTDLKITPRWWRV